MGAWQTSSCRDSIRCMRKRCQDSFLDNRPVPVPWRFWREIVCYAHSPKPALFGDEVTQQRLQVRSCRSTCRPVDAGCQLGRRIVRWIRCPVFRLEGRLRCRFDFAASTPAARWLWSSEPRELSATRKPTHSARNLMTGGPVILFLSPSAVRMTWSKLKTLPPATLSPNTC
ncbi:hypothetical protein K227x_41370 [Rubripirellula lacrimiformis]|uniref:Uncharacterized protein n=1 Tax=Rubripirellula lacrimiformis TaxID=1930273 RepID=A0A517NF24_9BACT|nr:hypothetical protein K227x_41370 [Rubripirellula lacrimiformis]